MPKHDGAQAQGNDYFLHESSLSESRPDRNGVAGIRSGGPACLQAGIRQMKINF
jgi:hypothetical protein